MVNNPSTNEELLIKEIERKDQIIDGLNREIVGLYNLNEELKSNFLYLEREISQSILWNIFKKLETRVIKRIMPPGTYRMKIYHCLLISIKYFSQNKKLHHNNHDKIEISDPILYNGNEKGISASIYKTFLYSIFQNKTIKSPYYEDEKNFPELYSGDYTRLIAFYLPQYHPIPENDAWWGKGFTDWINVAKAVPQFIGHYQPHLPDELGFYDLRLPEVLNRQIELARKYGIYGFCFHYYWFDGKRLLEGPLFQFLKHREISFPFCICWANENWTRRWDGQDQEILIAQNYSQGFERAFMEDLAPFLRDPRYIRINGKPVIIVYCAQNLPDAKTTTSIWREYCTENGIGDVFLIAAQTFNFSDPRLLGFDAAVEFPPHNMSICQNITRTLTIVNPHFAGSIYQYPAIIHEKLFAFETPYTLFRCILPGWDNSARRINNPLILHGSTPALYRQWLIDTIKLTKNTLKTGEQFVFINAWNEWAEGAHLEPDKKFGYSYLNVTAEALIQWGKNSINQA